MRVHKTSLNFQIYHKNWVYSLEQTNRKDEWLSSLLVDMSLLPHPVSYVSLHCDSQTTIAKVKSKNYKEKKEGM